MKIHQNQNLLNYHQMNKNTVGILGLIVGVVSFGINYAIALKTYPNTPLWATRMLYYGCFMALSLSFYNLTLKQEKKIKHLIFYAGSNFYMFLTIAYSLNQIFDILINQNKIIFTLIFTVLSCIIYYLFSYQSR